MGSAKVDSMQFAEVNSADGISFLASELDGILGLGYGSISIDKLPTFLDASTLHDKSFSFYLHENPDQSYMTLPGFSKCAMENGGENTAFEFHDVVEKRYWSLNLTGMKQGDKAIPVDGYKAVIDSGTSVLVGPNTLVTPLIDGITVAEDCSNRDTLPNISFTIDTIEYVLTPMDYVLEVDDSGDKACMLAVMGQDFPSGFNYFILGDSFMRKYYSYFDKNNNRVGFVRAAK